MLNLSLVTPAKKFLTDVDVEEIFVPTYRGELNILEGHAPLMAMLDTGVLRYRLKGEGKMNAVSISWGYLEVSLDRITVLAETAEVASAIDVARAKTAQDRAEKALTSNDLEERDFRKYQLKLQRAIVRQQLASESPDALAAKSTTH